MKKRSFGSQDEPKIVFSTAHGRHCEGCGAPEAQCRCPKEPPPPPLGTKIVVRKETKGRAGKAVTTVTGLPLRLAELEILAAALKKRCGTGGTVKDGIIEIQGEHRDTIAKELEGRGHQVVRG